ncbi:hypothetical protein [Amycolatopsis sp. CA-230715]|uniref:hypothetical protein n=1 Tax=Amycolatopsis sp. CA-230715 TaxID=2745196 RepID=UPI001C014663|nr:hypothetical protein [Amycolatopsis sp. CA-230715]
MSLNSSRCCGNSGGAPDGEDDLADALSTLTPLQRQAVPLMDFDGDSRQTAADIMGISRPGLRANLLATHGKFSFAQ